MIEQVLQKIAEHTQSGPVVVEAAHIYADKKPGLEQQKGAQIAAQLCEGLNVPSIRMLLIDDFNVTTRSLDTNEYLSWLSDQGYIPDEIVMESELVPAAMRLLQELKDTVPAKKLVVPKYDPWQRSRALGLWTRVGKVPLLTTGGRPSCALLDASFYLQKSQKGLVSLTVLPQEYSPQQAATMAILERVNKPVPVVNLYFQPNNGHVSIESQNNNI